MKKRLYLITTCVAWALFGSMIVLAQSKWELQDCGALNWWTRWCFSDSNDPLTIVKEIVDNDDSDIIETELDTVINTQIYGQEFTLAWTLESVRQQMAPYVQRIAFIGLTVAVVAIIYNGVLLVATPLSPDQVSAVKKRMLYIVAWVVLITWFYFIMKILLAVFVDIFVK